MKRMLFNATYSEELRVAAVEGQKLINFDIETSSKEQRRGNIYKGFITRVEPSLEACFVDYGTDKQGFLPFKEIDYKYLPDVNGQRSRDLSKIPLGTELIIQVEKDERGNKGAALTTYITLPGRYLVLMPNNSRAGGISRRIEGEERDELKSLMSQLVIPGGMSIILRTAALGRVVEELQWDLTYLTRLWGMVVEASKDKGAFLIYLESSLVIRSIRDHFSPDISEVLIDTPDVYQQAKKFMSLVMPTYADRIKLYNDDVPLFSRFQVEHQIESAYSRAVTLPSGGVIVIDHTEALTAVDVNSAKANKGADIETTAFLTNLEAAEEVARQLRLRDLGGLVVVDFIDMENQRNQRDLENHFKNQLSVDRARIQMGKLSKFGLLELSRQRLQASLDESTTITCPRCDGVGSIRGIESGALHILRIIQEEAVKHSHTLSGMHVQLPVDVATYLLNERREDVAKIESRMRVKIVLVPNVHLTSPHYKIKKLTHDVYDSNFAKSSYNLVEVPEETLGYKSVTKKGDSGSKVPAIQEMNHEPAPLIINKNSSFFGELFKKLGSLFANEPRKPEHPVRRNHNNRNNRNNTKSFDGNDKNGRNNRNESGVRTRPVTTAKQNNKVQTVRQMSSTNQSSVTSNQETVNNVQRFIAQSDNARDNKVQSKDVSHNNDTKSSVAKDPASVRANKSAQGFKPSASMQKTRQKSDFTKKHVVDSNIAPKSEDVLDITQAPTLPKKEILNDVVAVKPLAVNTVEVIPEVVEVAKKEKVIQHKPVPQFDLGDLQLVSTDKSLPLKEVVVDDSKVLRHNDRVVIEKHINLEAQYELVETKK
ncbi:MAG: Rne/Rng family ribonuclease [Burkholderiales bacterium]|nr:Rne/Rng family ribonuclease [Burkholderiales bacterium]